MPSLLAEPSLSQTAAKINPNSETWIYDLGIAWSQQGRIDKAISEWQTALKLQPDNLNACYNLVWVFATFPDDMIRSGAKAVALGERALRLSDEKDPRIYRLLAAYAEDGQFDKAIETAQRGAQLATAQGDYTLASTLESNINLY
jgi:tetratricopeptide (TPR) repeat protein